MMKMKIYVVMRNGFDINMSDVIECKVIARSEEEAFAISPIKNDGFNGVKCLGDYKGTAEKAFVLKSIYLDGFITYGKKEDVIIYTLNNVLI